MQADLLKCFRLWQEKRLTETFILGQADIHKNMHFSNRLFGREKELLLLKNIFENVFQGNVKTVFVSGYAGVGKISLVNKFYMVSINGQFIRGSYEQYQRDIPYSGIINIIGDLIRQIMSREQEEIASWRDRKNEVLDINVGVIAEVIPEIELITGECQPVEALSTNELESRFLQALINFIQLFIFEISDI